MRIGVLGCGYDCDENIDKVLKPWFDLYKNYNFVFSFSYGPFKEYVDLYKPDQKESFPSWYEKYSGYINKFNRHYGKLEHEARNESLQYLLQQGCDIIWLLDLTDEIYTSTEIDSTIKYVQRDTETAWYKICFKNYVFDEKTFLAEPFCPPRIFRTNIYNYKLDKCYWDNDFIYKSTKNGDELNQNKIGYKVIPRGLAFVKHYTWLSNEKTRKKVEYQNAHFGNGNCSYSWDYEVNKLIFNKEYFDKLGIRTPMYFIDI